MPAERFFSDCSLIKGDKIFLKGDEAFHLIRVMRARVGDEVELVNGKGQLAKATVLAAHKDKAELALNDVQNEPIPLPSFILCIALPRFSRLEFIIEKGTELGCGAFWLFPGDRSEKKSLSDNQNHRLALLSIAALKQCGRLDLPEIVVKPSLDQWNQPSGTLLFGDTSGKAPLLSSQNKHPILFFSGPEAGFSPKEITVFEKWSAKGVSLHRNILRADTAPIVAAAILGI